MEVDLERGNSHRLDSSALRKLFYRLLMVLVLLLKGSQSRKAFYFGAFLKNILTDQSRSQKARAIFAVCHEHRPQPTTHILPTNDGSEQHAQSRIPIVLDGPEGRLIGRGENAAKVSLAGGIETHSGVVKQGRKPECTDTLLAITNLLLRNVWEVAETDDLGLEIAEASLHLRTLNSTEEIESAKSSENIGFERKLSGSEAHVRYPINERQNDLLIGRSLWDL